MAKKKKFEYQYRLKNKYWRLPIHREWFKCNEESKDKIESMYKNQYDFERIEPPKPTKNMLKAEETKEKE